MTRTICTAVAFLWANILIICGILGKIEVFQQVGFVILVPSLAMAVILIVRWTDRRPRRGKITIIKRANFSKA